MSQPGGKKRSTNSMGGKRRKLPKQRKSGSDTSLDIQRIRAKDHLGEREHQLRTTVQLLEDLDN